MNTALAEKVRALREKQGLPYKKIAEAVGCDISTIYRIRDGLITNPSYQIGKAINDLSSAHDEDINPKKVTERASKSGFKASLLRSEP